MSTKTLLNQLEQWHKRGKHEEIVKALLALPVNEDAGENISLPERASALPKVQIVRIA